MSEKYKFHNPDGMYFTTSTVVEWIDVFTKNIYRDIIVDSLKHCQQNKGLIIHAWCIMTNHVHLIISKKENDEQIELKHSLQMNASGEGPALQMRASEQFDTGARLHRVPDKYELDKHIPEKLPPNLSSIIRDYKKFTSKELLKALEDDNRGKWILDLMKSKADEIKRNKNFKFWRDGNHPVELDTNKMMEDRLNYIHENPVKAGFVYRAEDYVYSSAADYAGEKGLLDIELIK